MAAEVRAARCACTEPVAKAGLQKAFKTEVQRHWQTRTRRRRRMPCCVAGSGAGVSSFNEALAHQRAEMAAGRKRNGYATLCARLPALKAQHLWLCPPLRGLQRVPGYGFDRQLWGGEIRTTAVILGSGAAVRNVRLIDVV